MSKNPVMIHPEAKFLSSCEPVKPNMCFQNTMVGQKDNPTPQGRNRKEEVTGPKQVQNLARQIPLDLKSRE